MGATGDVAIPTIVVIVVLPGPGVVLAGVTADITASITRHGAG